MRPAQSVLPAHLYILRDKNLLNTSFYHLYIRFENTKFFSDRKTNNFVNLFIFFIIYLSSKATVLYFPRLLFIYLFGEKIHQSNGIGS